MFDKEYAFKGSHAEKVIKLTAKIDDRNQIFKRNYDVYLMAPIVGFYIKERLRQIIVEIRLQKSSQKY